MPFVTSARETCKARVPFEPFGRQGMNPVITTSRFICAFVGAMYLFGQLFFGAFAVAPTIAGVCGVLAGTVGAANRTSLWLLLPVCTVGVMAVGADAYDYYVADHAPGNYYAWPEAVIFAVAFLLIATGRLTQQRFRL